MNSLFSRFTGKIRVKLLAALVLILIVFFSVTLAFSSPILFRAFTIYTYRELCTVTDAVDQLIPHTATYYFDLYSLSRNYNVTFEIVDRDGYLVYTSKGSGSALSMEHFPSSGLVKSEYAEMTQSPNYQRMIKYDNFEIKRQLASSADFFVLKKQLNSGDFIYAYSPVADVENVVYVADKVYFAINAATILALAIIFFGLISKITKPIEEINEITGDMADLDFSRKLEDYGNDEIGTLGRSINKLSDALSDAMLDLKDKNKQLEKDIELRLALDNARKSFISNVSHELKTPISIISGYAEGLCEGISDDPQMISEYCNIIHSESQKMNDLVLELLEISKLESMAQSFTPASFDFGEMTASLLEHFTLQFAKNGITVINKIPKSISCFAQKDKIEIVLKNYIINAISHCSGEKKLILYIENFKECYRVNLFNTGEGIPEADISELWDSFYRGDKSHDRSEGRFGLGLSIVKTIMDNHHCDYGVKNAPGGVVFSFTIAKDASYYEKKAEQK